MGQKNSTQTWLLLAAGEDREYAGNDGYQDEISSVYRYTNTVSNSRNLKAGDTVILRTKKDMLGIGLVEEVRSRPGQRKQSSCPRCNTGTIKVRKTKRPKYRCENKHEFPTPNRQIVDCIRFEAHFGKTFTPTPSAIPMATLKEACYKTSDMQSIQKINPRRLDLACLTSYLLAQEKLGPVDAVDDNYQPNLKDEREKVVGTIRLRRGQKKFRNALLARYNRCCQITGCRIIDVLEAAHIAPFRGEKDNTVTNGLLLRADIHTLFDLDLLGIDPEVFSISLHPSLKHCDSYGALDQKKLNLEGVEPNKLALGLRWELFLAKIGTET